MQLLAVLKPTMKKHPPANHPLTTREKSAFKLPPGRIVNTFCRSKRNRFFTSALRIENKKKQRKNPLEFQQPTAKTIKLLLVKKSMLTDSKRNCSHVNGIQLQSAANILPALFTNIFLPALQGYTLYLKGSYSGYDFLDAKR